MGNSYSEIPHYLSSENFYTEVKRRIKGNLFPLTLVTLDFDNFNYINDLFSYEIGDLVLEKITAHFSAKLNGTESFSNVHADHFTFCLDICEPSLLTNWFQDMLDLRDTLSKILPPHYNLAASCGMIVVKDNQLSLSALLDKANYARKKTKGNAAHSFRFYDDKMNEDIRWQKFVTFAMSSALKNNEFEMYLQPKVLIETGEIVGAEALARWNNPEYGLIYPDRFIPILEQNGFIRQLDFYILSEACRFLKKSSDLGIVPLPISINFSRAHLPTENLVEQIFRTVNRMGIATNLIEIEFTENLSYDGFERLIEVVTDLKLLGFKVSLDDFGSAYSSLNCLKDLPIDIIKIDKGFLNASTNSENGKVIIAKMVELIKSLHKLSVMEGVETDDQVSFLQNLSCDLGQGYFYARPMTKNNYVDYLHKGPVVADIEAYLSNRKETESKDHLHVIPKDFQMDNWELYTLGKNIDMGLMKGYLDGEATVQYVNDRALEYLGYTRQEFREIFDNSIVAFTHPDDAAIIEKNAKQLVNNGKALEFQTRAIRKDGKIIILKGRSSCVIDSHGRPVGIYAFQDVTEDIEKTASLQKSLKSKIAELEATIESERKTKEALGFSEERYRLIVDQSNDIMFDWDFIEDSITFSDKYINQFGENPLTENLTTNVGIRERIYPEDLYAFEKWIAQTYKHPGTSEGEYRIKNAENNYIWMHCRSTAICNEKGKALRAVGVFANVNDQKKQMDTLLLKSQRDPLTRLLNKTETQNAIIKSLESNPNQTGALFILDIDNFKGINDNLGHQFGDTVLEDSAIKISSVFRDSDIIGRIGGDEIAIYLPDCNESIIYNKADLLSRAIRITYYGSAEKYNITASIGIAFYPSHGKNFEELYHLADIALYESKNNGKDQYSIYRDSMAGPVNDKRTPVEWTESFLTTYFQKDFPFQIFEMLYESKDLNASIYMILELLGKQYHTDRTYIFQNDADRVINTYKWYSSDIAPGTYMVPEISGSTMASYYNHYTKEGIFCCNDSRETDPLIYSLCDPQGVKSFLHCSIYHEGKTLGFIGFDSCNDYHNWTGEEIAILGYISRILSVFLYKRDAMSKLQISYKNYVEMLGSMSGYVYVVDPTTYEVLYINNNTRKLGFEPGKPCHELAFGLDKPCKKCPIQHLSDTVHHATEEIFSKFLNVWMLSSGSKIKWEGDRDAVLISCTDISKYKRN